jgi:HK97 family phage major capsid protein
MEVTEIKKSLDTLGNDWAEFKRTNDARLKEIEKKGVADPLHQEKLDKVNKSMDDAFARLEKIEALKNSHVPDIKEAKTAQEKEEKAAVNAWFKKGTEISTKSLTEGVNSEGGYVVRPEFSDLIVSKIFESSPIRQLATVQSISGSSYQEAASYTEADAGWVAEIAARPVTTAVTFDQLNIPLYEVFAMPQATQRLLDDSYVNIEQWHAEKVAEKLARMEATAFVSGDGVNKPTGILSYANGLAYGQVEQVNSGNAALLTADGLISLQASLFEAFQANAVFLMKRATVAAVRQLKTSTGEYLWGYAGQLNNPMGMSLLGKPVMFADDVPAVAANALSVIYGDIRQGYMVVENPGIRVLRDAYTAKPYVLFYTTKRVGGEVRNFQAIKIQKVAV